MEKKKIRFIINPKSGTARRKDVPALVESILDRTRFDADIFYTKEQGHATTLAREAAGLAYDVVVAVGGDGSVNETAAGLLGSQTALGIVPAGSGNGLARHLLLPMDSRQAVKLFNNCRTEAIDTMEVNEHLCVGTTGVGFDAHIAHLFAHSTVRGYSTYVKLVLREFYKYKPSLRTLVIDGKEVSEECFLLTFANSSQFGNNAIIAPFADVKDGIIDVSIVNRFALYLAPHLIYRLMRNTLHQSRFFRMFKGKEICLRNEGPLMGHIDGEPVTFHGDLYVKIKPASLKVIVPALAI